MSYIEKGRYVPQQPNMYQGRQIILNSDRVLFNAKRDSVLLYADKSIGLNTAGTINFDTGQTKEGVNHNKFIVNSPNIHLGLIDGEQSPTEPAVLGNSLEEWLNDLIEMITDLLFFLTTRYTVFCPIIGPSAPGPNDISVFLNQLSDLRLAIKDIKSVTVKLT
jgi:hypothetical protein